jgi:hypothetical protein
MPYPPFRRSDLAKKFWIRPDPDPDPQHCTKWWGKEGVEKEISRINLRMTTKGWKVEKSSIDTN